MAEQSGSTPYTEEEALEFHEGLTTAEKAVVSVFTEGSGGNKR
jgi:hypothetical protein